ncbi:MAG TPA: rhomboid family intramembrane serine protease [Candidatus Acidoferrales bacterium]
MGATAGKCHQCGANLTFSFAAASRSLGRFMPQSSPVTYGVLTLCCVLYGVSLLSTIHQSGFAAPTGGLGALFGLGGINSGILARMGASAPLPYDLVQPWRLVTAIFLHASLLHIGFNMWILMDLGPMLEEMYGSARFLFIFVLTGVCGYLASAATGHFSVGASGSLLGMVGVLLALTGGRQSSGMRMLRSQLIYWLVYIAVIGFLMPGIDNFAHIGGFVSGFVLGKLMVDRLPADTAENRRANALGWTAGLMIAASFAFMLLNYFYPALGRS